MPPLDRTERIPVREVTRKPRTTLRTDDYSRAFVPPEFPTPRLDLRSLAPALSSSQEDVSLKTLLRRLEPVPAETLPEPEPDFTEEDLGEEITHSEMTPDEWSRRRMMFLGVGGIGALFGLAVAGAAVVFISIAQPTNPPREDASYTEESPQATRSVEIQPAASLQAPAAPLQAPAASMPAPVPVPQVAPAAAAAMPARPNENVERTLQQFMQWRQKTGAAPR